MFIMGRTRRGFTPEYKDEAVKLVINTGRTVATAARELGLKEQTLGRWVHDFRARAITTMRSRVPFYGIGSGPSTHEARHGLQREARLVGR
jgi:transposase-like protein